MPKGKGYGKGPFSGPRQQSKSKLAGRSKAGEVKSMRSGNRKSGKMGY